MMPDEGRPGQICLLEKTPRNALNIPFLNAVFPDARYIYLYRDPRQTVASLIEAWSMGLKNGRFQTFRKLPGWDRNGWCFLLPRGWRDLRGKSLAEIAAFQWIASNEQILHDLEQIGRHRMITMSYSDIVSQPDEELRRVCRFAEFDADDVPTRTGGLPLSRTTISPPDADKWKRVKDAIESQLPALSATQGRIDAFVGRAD